jgi:hypothetical protein
MISFSDVDPEWSNIIDDILYISFFMDLVLTFFTGIQDKEENIIYNSKVF